MHHTNSSKRSSFVQILIVFACAVFILFGNIALAVPPPLGGSSGAPPATGGLVNPLKSDSLEEFLLDIIQILIIFAIPLIILMIIYAGFLYVLARGSEEQVTKATRAFTYAIVGGLLILGAELILQVVKGTVDQLTR